MNEQKTDARTPKKKRNGKFEVGRLFYNNKFVLVFSVFFALVLWVFMSFNNTEKNPRAVPDVPVVIKLSDSAQQAGLRVFSPVDAKAKVWIKGNSLTVNQITSTDMQVSAQEASSISAPGNYVLNLSVNKQSTLTDYNVVEIEPSSLNIYVDTYVEKIFKIDKSQIKYQIASTCYMNEPLLSTDEATVSGPQQEIEKIDKVILRTDAGSTPLTETKHISSNLILLDAYGNEINSANIKLSVETVDIIFNVLPRKVLPLSIEFTNMPSMLTFPKNRISIEPAEIEVAGPEDALANLSELQLTPIDFSAISPTHNTFDVDITLQSSFKNVSNVYTAKVELDLSNFATRTMALNTEAIKFRNLGADRDAQVYTHSLNVTVVGPESEISKLTENNLVAQIDMTGKEEFTGQTEMPATVSVSGAGSSWVYGSYKVNIGVTQKDS